MVTRGVSCSQRPSWRRALGVRDRRRPGLMDGVLTRAERTEEGWSLAELLRKKGELLLLQLPMAVADCEECFRQALDVADRLAGVEQNMKLR